MNMHGNVTSSVSTKNENRSEARGAIVLPGQAPDGKHVLSVIFKRTYDINPGGRCKRAAVDVKLNPGDVHYDGPMNSAVKFESDLIPWKIATDVVFNGAAYAPKQSPVQQLLATLTVGSVSKTILVNGDRTCYFRKYRDPGFSDPAPFVKMDLRYERAYGGIDIFSDPSMQYPYPRNHLGCGFVVKNTSRCIEGLRLPNIEDPENILHPGNICCNNMKNWKEKPMPQGFGWYLKYWHPRAALAGVMPADRVLEQKLRSAYALLVPESQKAMFDQTQLPSMDFAFFNGASPGLTMPFLNGDEAVHCSNLTPECDLRFNLPGEKPKLKIDIGFGEQHPEVVLHTLMIRMEERQIDLVWRGACTYGGPDSLLEIKKKEISIQ